MFDKLRNGTKFETHVMTYKAMMDDKFWEIVEHARKGERDPGAHISALRAELSKLAIEDLAGFQSAFADKMRRAYNWDLWAAACIVHRGCSDDGFHYFRTWLVFKGREIYDAALADADVLARFNPAAGPEGYWMFEELAYVANEVWRAKGGEGDIRDATPSIEFPDAPAGRPWKESSVELAERFPQLYARFGNSPFPRSHP